jgi:hypothetical protein
LRGWHHHRYRSRSGDLPRGRQDSGGGKRGIELAVCAICGHDETQKDGSKKHVKGELDKFSKEVKESTMIAQVGAVSANNDLTIGHIIAEAMKKLGKGGVITMEEAKTMETALEVVEGMQFDRGYLPPYFVTSLPTPSVWSDIAEHEPTGCGSQQHRTPVAVDEKAASEQAVRDEVVRARHKAVRVHHKPEAEGVPPFSDHSGSL